MSILSTLTNLIPGVSTLKTAVYVGVFTIAGLAFWHYNNVIKDLATEKAKNVTLQQTINTQDETIKQSLKTIQDWKAAQDKLTMSIQALAANNLEAEQYVKRLENIYAKHNLEDLSIKQPSAIEARINSGTVSAMRLLKCASEPDDADCQSRGTRQDAAPTKPNGNSTAALSLGSHH